MFSRMRTRISSIGTPAALSGANRSRFLTRGSRDDRLRMFCVIANTRSDKAASVSDGATFSETTGALRVRYAIDSYMLGMWYTAQLTATKHTAAGKIKCHFRRFM